MQVRVKLRLLLRWRGLNFNRKVEVKLAKAKVLLRKNRFTLRVEVS